MSCETAIYPGTFDPITNGHLSVISRALKIFDKLVIVILINPQKSPLFSLEERIFMIKETLKNKSNIEVESFEGLLVDYCDRVETTTIIRGLRAVSDFEYEFQMAMMNRHLNPNVETFFMMASEAHFYTASRLVKEVAALGGDVSALVPDVVNRRLLATVLPQFK